MLGHTKKQFAYKNNLHKETFGYLLKCEHIFTVTDLINGLNLTHWFIFLKGLSL